jgi:hypothetical protein
VALMDVFTEAEPGTEYVVTRYRLNNQNLGTEFRRIVKRAGLQPWPRSFQNLRSTRETELCKQFPEHVVCAWIGNSKVIAREHYLQVRDEDFERAAQTLTGVEKSAQNPAQSEAATARDSSQTTGEHTYANRVLPVETSVCELSQSLATASIGPGRI